MGRCRRFCPGVCLEITKSILVRLQLNLNNAELRVADSPSCRGTLEQSWEFTRRHEV
jgi:hypothetical protein